MGSCFDYSNDVFKGEPLELLLLLELFLKFNFGNCLFDKIKVS